MMAPASKRERADGELNYIAVLVEDYTAHVRAAINHYARAPEVAINLRDDDPLYKFTTRLEIRGKATHPSSHAGEVYEITISGDDAPSHRINLTLKDVHSRDERWAHRYRKYRGREVPIYEVPTGIGSLEKVRGEPRWRGWVFAKPSFVTDALVLLGHQKTLFLAIDEYRVNRARWIRDLALQTTDPAEE